MTLFFKVIFKAEVENGLVKDFDCLEFMQVKTVWLYFLAEFYQGHKLANNCPAVSVSTGREK
jgi:hypothetical protein